MGTPINWKVPDGADVLYHPTYLKYAASTFNDITASDVKTDLKAALASNEAADLAAYLSWVLRVLALVA